MTGHRYKTGGINVMVQAALLVAAVLLIGLLAFRQIQRVLGKGRPVVVAAVPLAPGTELDADHLAVVKARQDQVPPGALRSIGDARGRTLEVGKESGNAIVEDDFRVRRSTPTSQLSNLIPEGRVLTTLTLKNITVPHNDLRQGDRVDILAHSSGTSASGPARLVVEDAYVVGYLTTGNQGTPPQGRTLMGVNLQPALANKSSGKGKGLLLALHPDDVLPLAEVDGSGSHINLVLHSRQSVEAGEMLSVARPRETHNTVDVILGPKREKVTVQ